MSEHLTDEDRDNLMGTVIRKDGWEPLFAAVERIVARHRSEAEGVRMQYGHLAYENRVQTERAEQAEAEVERLEDVAETNQAAYEHASEEREAAEAERDRLRAAVERVEALAEEWDHAGFDIEAGQLRDALAELEAER